VTRHKLPDLKSIPGQGPGEVVNRRGQDEDGNAGKTLLKGAQEGANVIE
jgi:hypothetical protein